MSIRHAFSRSQEHLLVYLRSQTWAKRIAWFSLVLVILMVALPLWKLLPIVSDNPFIPLHYNIYLGIDRFGPWYQIFILPVIGGVILLLNLSLAASFSEGETRMFRLGRSEPILSRLLLWVTPIIEIILLFGMVFTILLNL